MSRGSKGLERDKTFRDNIHLDYIFNVHSRHYNEKSIEHGLFLMEDSMASEIKKRAGPCPQSRGGWTCRPWCRALTP
jgi:hypothetical protein